MSRNDAKSIRAAAIARHAVSGVDRRAPIDANALAAAQFVREWIRYSRELPETIANLEALDRIPVGDCDDMVVALSALLWRLGYGWDRQRYGIGHRNGNPVHVWLEARGERGDWIPLDPSTWRIDPGEDPADFFPFSSYYPLASL
jgi:transglutaminase-like putative cysteine protease